MPCPTCGSDEVVPLVLRRFDGLAGAVKLCAECREVFLVASEARLPDALADVQVRGWNAVRALLAEAVDAVADHPAVRGHLARSDVEADVFHRDALEAMEHAVAALAPMIRTLAGSQEGGES